MTTDERKAIEQVQAALGTLTPATARDDATAFDLRYAVRFMTEAMANRYSGERHLNVLRASGSNALSAVAVSFDRRTLTQSMIQTARQAVAALLDQAPE